MPRVGAAILAAAALVPIAGCGGSTHSTKAAPGDARVSVSVDQCGKGWTGASAGPQHFTLANVDVRAGEVSLTDAKSGAVYDSIEPIGPGTTTHLSITLGAGSYRFVCAMEDTDLISGPVVTLHGSTSDAAVPVQPVTQADLITATKGYETYVKGQLPTLDTETQALAAAIDTGDRSGAETAWLTAHAEYERLGAAYGAFGDLDAAINGLPNGLPQGIHDPGWKGFHKVEYGLWHGEPLPALRPATAALLTSVRALQKTLADTQIDPAQLSIRAHEITENALQFELTGQTDFGSHCALATIRANLDGTQTVLALVRPLLAPRYTGLAALDTALAKAKLQIDALKKGARWPPLTALATSERERLDATISDLSERLAPVASILEPRRAS
ncbi:MAG TPA: EfeM/EfeO family lipoprotein [Frankiaceae bacterium]|nr:EfeM/EfeO family lipoprotein [Frankiaceae bacterium]